MKKYLPALVCGFGAGVLQVVPFLRGFSCCLVMPLAAYFALTLEQKSTNSYKKIDTKKAILIGLYTGLFAAFFASFFETLITLITKHNDVISVFAELQKMIEGSPFLDADSKKEYLYLFQKIREDILNYGFSALYTFPVLIGNAVINSVFGMVGALIGSQIINSRINNQSGDM